MCTSVCTGGLVLSTFNQEFNFELHRTSGEHIPKINKNCDAVDISTNTY